MRPPLLATTTISLVLYGVLVSAAAATAAARTKYNFNSDWKVLAGSDSGASTTNASDPAFDDSDWKALTLPYAWNEDDAFKNDIVNLSTGIAWYRKHFKVPAAAAAEKKKKKVFLEFEGIRHGGEFYLNGKWIGRSENGVMAFGFDVTDFIITTAAENSTTTTAAEENVLAARIDNSWTYREVSSNSRYQWNDQNFYANYGGINKNVFLHVTDKLYQTLPLYSNLNTTGVYVYATDIDVGGGSAKITAESEVRNERDAAQKIGYKVVVRDVQTGKTVKTISDDSSTVTLAAGSTKTINASAVVSGLHFWSWGYGYLYDVSTSIIVDNAIVDTVTTRTGFRKTEFKDVGGMFKLNDRVLHLKGYAQRTTNEWPSLGSAVPAWLSDFSNRLILASNGSLVRWMHVTPWKQDVESLDRLGILQALPAGDSEGDVTGRRWEQRKELMRDAIIYNRNNPSVVFYESGNEAISEAHMTEMVEIRDTYDPHGGRAAGCREMLDSTVAEYGGEMLYINKNARIPFWSHEYSRDEGLRKYWDDYSPPYHPDGEGPLHNGDDASEYNRNQDSHALENVRRWFDYYESRAGTGKRVNSGGVNIVFSDSNTHHRGAENYRRSGEVDAVRLPKDGWYAHQVMWNTWVDATRPAVHLVGHWNYNTSTVKDVYAIASGVEKVELFLNGKSLGFGKRSYEFLYTFPNITFVAGTLTAKAGSVSASLTTAGEPAALRLTPIVSPAKGGLVANGADIALVDIEVIDSKGRRCPTALNTISFALADENNNNNNNSNKKTATWRGGIAQGPDNYILSTTLPVENGINRVLLRTTTTAGEIILTATSPGLASASVTLVSRAFPKVGSNTGLSLELPSDGLKSDLSRGPTPAGSSYSIKRKTVEIAAVSAGSDADNAQTSYDDNELSHWTATVGTDSNGTTTTTTTAWIRYELEGDGKSEIDEVVLKLPGFRTSTYNIRISVDDDDDDDDDDRTVWVGKSPTNLGYATFKFNATLAGSVRVESTGGKLGIVEAEIYGPI